ncbi:MAG: hypothetical protein EA357_02840 [Micavibrio sp.]|nr:MAG: hypothetical protein EA357_02840 [Micavibrio sp.]
MLHHIEIYVSELEKSAAFWGALLEEEFGYTPYQQWQDGRSWKKDGHYIVFVQTREKYSEDGYHRCRTGLNHLAFQAGSRAQIDALREKLVRRGVTLLYDDRFPHAGGAEHYALYCEDPDRIKVEIIAPKAKTEAENHG